MDDKLLKKCKEVAFLNHQIKSYQLQLDELKKEVIALLKKEKIDNINISLIEGETEKEKIICNIKVIKRTSVDFDIKKLKSRLSKKVRSKIIERKVEISDYSGFSDFMKQNNITFSQIKCYLNIIDKVNMKNLDNLFKRDEINLNEINDCYKIIKSNYLKITELKDE
ncbi:hypothetical protein [Anaerofustis sp.]|uniref:hypothetical protein n=1 Tax=Anaerofustis sp. TaxID=1872517 RepID=UPI0025B8C41F|nr:hypothetical protein [Anaerofustis sp.]